MTGSNQSARSRLAAELQQQVAVRRRRRTIGIAALTGVVIMAIVVVFIAMAMGKPASSGPASSGSTPGGPTSSSAASSASIVTDYVVALQSVPAASLDAVGAGAMTKNPAQAIPGGTPQLVGGLPRLVYVGAEFCPFCGVERWPLVIALSRFGTFSGLKATLTSPNEGSISNIPTVTFVGSTYISDYVTFSPTETSDRLGAPLQTLSDADSALFTKYQPGGNIPWLYTGTSQQLGASYNGAAFLAGADGNSVAAKLSDTNSTEAQAILGAANVQTARLCTLTGGKPQDVCLSPGVVSAAKVLG